MNVSLVILHPVALFQMIAYIFAGPAQQLYVRLFQRKHAWIRASKLDYPKIAADLTPVIAELQSVQLLQGGWLKNGSLYICCWG